MGWRSRSELEGMLEGSPLLDNLAFAYGLREFALLGSYPTTYLASPAWADLLTLSDAGKDYLALLSEAERFPLGDVYQAVFGRFYYHDLLIDLEESDLEGVCHLLSSELLESRIRWPYRFGRLLYDKFNDATQQDGVIRFLEPEQVAALLEGTPQGVYQVGKILSGPLGLLRSREARFLPPTMGAPLWHCSDTGCTITHNVWFRPPRIPLVIAYNQLQNAASNRLGPESEWLPVLQNLHRKSGGSGVRRYYDLLALIGDSIVRDERTTLVVAALESSQRVWLRQVLGSPPRRKKVAEGPAEQVAGSLSEAEQLQLLFLLHDSELVRLIDDCVLSGSIRVPSNEVRRAHFNRRKLNPYDSYTRLSSFGLRSQYQYPLVVLMSRIWETYESQGLLDDLSWKLGQHVDTISQRDLMTYLQDHDPVDSVRELILSSKPVALSIADGLDLVISANEEREEVANRFLWKLGFDPYRYDAEYPRLRARLGQFKDVLLRIGTIQIEDDREEIRGSGVNLFVSIEHFLEELISYNVWLLASDHFIDIKNRFRYDSRLALRCVGRVLGSEITIDDNHFAWDSEGGNTLGNLMVYLDEARRWMRSLQGRERSSIERHEEQLPAHVQDAELVFAYMHTELWADCDPDELAHYIEGFHKIATHLAKANPAAVRNGLDHKRSDSRFPSIDTMRRCVNHLQDALDAADINRYIPKTFWRISRNTDRFGRMESAFRDYLNRELRLREPSFVLNRGSLRFEQPVLVAPGNLLGMPNSELVFRVVPTSRYSEYWEGYPRRRNTPAPDKVELEDSTQPLSDEAQLPPETEISKVIFEAEDSLEDSRS